MPNARGDGVSFADLGRGRWKLRWREKKEDGGYLNRSKTIEGSALDRDRVMIEIRTALAETGTYEASRSAILAPPEPCTVADILIGCIDARVASGRYTGHTSKTYRTYAVRVLQHMHAAFKLPEDQPVSADVLSRGLFEQLQQIDRQRDASAQVRYGSLRFLMDAWSWAHDANVEARENGRRDPWPGLPTPPRSSRDYLPPTPRWGRTIAPSIAHVDAALRHLPERTSRGTRIAAIFMRYTGLRANQVLGIAREDIDLRERTLAVRTGKTAAERADARSVPLADALLGEPGVLGWVESAHGQLFRKRAATKGIPRQRSETFRTAWESATAAGEAPRAVWDPTNRRLARPEHAFRACFQAFMEDQNVADDVIRFLVGHEGGSVREVHYGRALLEAAREAVNKIPPVQWSPPEPDPPEGDHQP